MRKQEAISIFLGFVIFLSISNPLNGQNREFGPLLSLEIDVVEELAIGGIFRIPISNQPLTFSPYGTYYLGIDDGSLIEIGGNVVYNFGTRNKVFDFYSGLGLGLVRSSFGRNNNGNVLNNNADTELGLNVVGGAIFELGSLRPFTELRLMLGAADLVNVTGGLLFPF